MQLYIYSQKLVIFFGQKRAVIEENKFIPKKYYYKETKSTTMNKENEYTYVYFGCSIG